RLTINRIPDRPETPPCPLSTVPLLPDPDFVDHGTLLDQIHEKGHIPGARIALVGLGGVGLRSQSPDTWVSWIHASNAVRFEQSCREIAERAKIPGRQNPRANIYKLIYDWLNDATTRKWVLILDSLDDDGFLHTICSVEQEGLRSKQSGVPGRSIWSYFAHSLEGLIIITSRSRRVVSRLVEECNTIPVEPMDIVHATSLFEKKLGTQATKDDIIQLTMALDCIPLAIVQAAAYIKRRAPRESVAEYLERLRKNDLRKMNLLTHEMGHLQRDLEAKNSILVTWQISFDYIREMWPSAADLLCLMSFFDGQGIPEFLLRGYEKATYSPGSVSLQNDNDTRDRIRCEDSASGCSMVDNLEADILVLREFSLIHTSVDGVNFEMHCLVQLATQEWLKMHEQLERWKERFIRNLYINLLPGDFENWSRCQDLFAHVQRAITQQPDTDASLGEWASLLHESARFALGKGNLAASKIMAERATNAQAKLFSQHNQLALDSSEILALAYGFEGQWKKAEELLYRVIENREEILGPKHPATLTSLHYLEMAYIGQGRLKEAEELGIQVMENCIEMLGPESPTTVATMHTLAEVYLNQERWEEAEKLQTQVMEVFRNKLGPQHPETMASISHLASTYAKQRRWNEAQKLEIRVMETKKQVLGPTHPDTLTSMNNLASMYRKQGRWKDAELLQVEELKLCSLKLGINHPDTLASMDNLAFTYWKQERWKEAEELQVRLLKTCKRVLGPKHPDTLTSMANLAHILKSSDQDEAASVLMGKCSRLRNQQIGPGHSNTISSASTLSDWRTVSDSLPSLQSNEAPSENREKEPMEFAGSKQLCRDGRNRKRTIFFRLFRGS
ncbi:Kinesin light chain 3, partial [Penicillium rolfsii]